ncbi:MAG: hypothetical protein MUE51_15665 [Thermoleophilia bacterium]|nr:hypothetical protein [Thermoleophilia bacterium]
MRIEVSVDRTSYRPGEEVRGQVAILEGGPARRLLVRLRLDEVTPNVRVAAVTVDGGELARLGPPGCPCGPPRGLGPPGCP